MIAGGYFSPCSEQFAAVSEASIEWFQQNLGDDITPSRN
jgi:hypothetical protein